MSEEMKYYYIKVLLFFYSFFKKRIYIIYEKVCNPKTDWEKKIDNIIVKAFHKENIETPREKKSRVLWEQLKKILDDMRDKNSKD